MLNLRYPTKRVVNFGYAKFKISYEKGPFKLDNGGEVEGLTDFDLKVIKINKVFENTETGKEILMHELLHIIMYISGINVGGDSEKINIEEEDLVVRLTTGILTLINLNPGLINFTPGHIPNLNISPFRMPLTTIPNWYDTYWKDHSYYGSPQIIC